MKKISFIALVAIAAVAFTSCKPGEDKPGGGDDPQANVTIAVQPKSLNLGVNDEPVRLRAVITPTGTDLTLRWKSTNPSVASVTSAGLVTPIAEGETKIIVDAEGVKPDTCFVTVSDVAVLDNFQLAEYGIFGKSLTYIDGHQYKYDKNGVWYTAELFYSTVFAWDENVSYSETAGELVGNGFVIRVDSVPIYFITAASNTNWIGAYLNGGGFKICDTMTVVHPYWGIGGKIDVESYGDFVQKQMDGSVVEQDFDIMKEKTYGAHVSVNIDDEDGTYNYHDYGFYYGRITSGHMYFEYVSEESNEEYLQEFAMSVDFSNFWSDDRFLGFKVAVDTETEFQLAKPYDYDFLHRDYFEEFEPDAAPNRIGTNLRPDTKKFHAELPKNYRSMQTDKLSRK